MQQFFDQGGGQGIQLRRYFRQFRRAVSAFRRQSAIRRHGRRRFPFPLPAAQSFVHFGPAHFFRVFPQGGDGRNGVQGFPPLHKLIRLGGDQFLGLRRRLGQFGVAGGGRGPQSVNIAQADAGQQAHRRVNVPGDGDVNQQQRPPAALRHHFPHRLLSQQIIGRRRGADYRIGGRQSFIQILKGRGRAAQFPGKLRGPVVSAVGKDQIADAGGGQGPPGQLPGRAGSDYQYLPLRQIPQQPLGQFGPSQADRPPPLARQVQFQGCGPMGLPADPQGLMKQAGQRPPGLPPLAGRAERRPHLPQNLPLAHNHRIQPAGDPEQMIYAIPFRMVVAVGGQIRRRHAEIVGGKGLQLAAQGLFRRGAGRFRGQRIDFQPIAGGQEDAGADLPLQGGQRRRQGRPGYRQPFPHRHRRRAVIPAQD